MSFSQVILIFVTMTTVSCAITPWIRKSFFMDSSQSKIYLDDIISEQDRSKSPNYVGDVHFSDQISTNGWAFLEISTNSSAQDEVKAYAAGYVEGQLTSSLIYQHWYNVIRGLCSPNYPCKDIIRYLKKNDKWTSKMMRTHKNDSYWSQVRHFYTQLNGIYKGYKDAAEMKNLPTLSWTDIFLLNIQGDLEDLGEAFKNNSDASSPKVPTTRLIGPSCSGLIKILPDNKDIFVAHDTWTGYFSMLRIMKKYSFSYFVSEDSVDRVSGQEISFSSYPGIIHSGDDMYTMLPSRLTTLETTIGNSDPENWKYLSPSGQVLETIRTMVANRLATDAKSWADIFKNYTSGTYNNEWMIVDWNKFKPGSSPEKGFLRVLEQIPGLVVDEDRTDFLNRHTYWASYNVPYFPEVFKKSGVQKFVDEYGDWFTYDRNPRALIFKREHNKVYDLVSMMELMQFNNFQRDPLSSCNCTPPYSAENSIAARSDLNPKNGTYPFEALGHRNHGATDTKITSYDMSKSLEYYAISGPTSRLTNLPVFCWSTSGFPWPKGHPDCWDFKPVLHKWT